MNGSYIYKIGIVLSLHLSKMQKNISVSTEDLNTNTLEVGKRSGRLSLAQNYLLIWLDSNLNASDEDFANSLGQLREVVNTINTYTDYHQCLQFIHEASNENLLIIVSGSLGEQIIANIHPISQIHAIYIFCTNISKHEQWTQQWNKIKVVSSNIESICDQLKEDSRQCDRDSTSFEIINKNDLNQLEPTFMYTTLFKDIILEIKYEKNDLENLVNQCRIKYQGNKKELKIIKEFENKYQEHSPVWWYTRDCFTYNILNRSLGAFDVDMIISLGPFIQDLRHRLQQLYSEQKHTFQQTFIVYRGQALSKTNFDKLKHSVGGLLSFNNFLSTSINRSVSYRFAEQSLGKVDHVAVLFQMKIDSSIDKSPFALLDDESFYKDTEHEILFSMNSVFRVESIEQIDNSQVYQVDLTLTTSDIDQQFQLLYQQTQKDIHSSTPKHRLAALLIRLCHLDKSEHLFKSVIEDTSKDDYQEYSHLNCMLAVCYFEQGKYQESIEQSQKVIQIIEEFIPDQRTELAKAYACLGQAYDGKEEYLQALKYYGKALEIREEFLPQDHLDLAESYINIGSIHQRLGEFPKALEHYKKALQIQQKSLPAIHFGVAFTLNSIGAVCLDMNDFDQAKEYLHKSDDILKKCVPPFHPFLFYGQ